MKKLYAFILAFLLLANFQLSAISNKYENLIICSISLIGSSGTILGLFWQL